MHAKFLHTTQNVPAHLLTISNNKVKLNAAVYLYMYLKSSILGTLCDVINCLYSKTHVMLKLRRRARGHLMMPEACLSVSLLMMPASSTLLMILMTLNKL